MSYIWHDSLSNGELPCVYFTRIWLSRVNPVASNVARRVFNRKLRSANGITNYTGELGKFMSECPSTGVYESRTLSSILL